MTAPQIIFFSILALAFVLLATERLRNDLVAVLIVLALIGTRLLKPAQALDGFASEPAIVVCSVFVLSAALHQTGVSETLGAWIARLAGGGYTQALGVMMSAVALLSAFTHHVTMTAVMLPVTLQLCRDRKIPPSKLLMPMSFAASLGTTITIIGAPAFLLASGLLSQAGASGLGIFSIAPIGLALSAAGTLYMVTLGRFLLPARAGAQAGAEHFRLDDYLTEVTILPGSPFLGKTVAEVEDDDRYQLVVAGLVRGGRRQRASLEKEALREGDVLLVRTKPETIVAFRKEKGVELHPVQQYEQDGGGVNERDVADRLVQVIVAPGSELIGRTIGSIDFRRRYNALVLGLWRRNGWLEQELAQIRLRAGDVLVLQADTEALGRVANDPAFLMVVPFQGETRMRSRAPLATAIMVGTIGAAALGVRSRSPAWPAPPPWSCSAA